MKHLFSAEGEAALAATIATRPLLAFDFDGTLAPIVTRPDDARVPLAVARRLDRLSALLPVAIVTGRTVADVRGRLAFSPRFVVGGHGAEDPDADSTDFGPLFDALRARLHVGRAELLAAGVSVEDKGQSMALHYRLARDLERALGTITRLLEGLGPELHAYGGKRVVNVVATRAPDKAAAVASLVERCGVSSAVFVGDDINDEPVFARSEPSWLTVRIGREDPDTRAMFCIDTPREMAIMLDRMLMLLAPPSCA
jgi:trehalose 6-phosphate phosphatase